MNTQHIRKGDTVYQVEWVDLPNVIEPIPRVVAYEVVQKGKQIIALRRGGHRRIQRYVVDKVVFPFYMTHELAILAAIEGTQRKVRHAQSDIADALRDEAKLRELQFKESPL